MIINKRTNTDVILLFLSIIIVASYITVVHPYLALNPATVKDIATSTLYDDSGKSCTDGIQCQSSWCIDRRCLGYQLDTYTIGDYKAREVLVNGKSFLVSALNSTITLTTSDVYDPDFKQLKDKLCGTPEPTQASKLKSPFPNITCIVKTI